MFSGQYRCFIETKRRGGAGPDRPGSREGETQREQVRRYLDALRKRNLDLFADNKRPWRGFLTDGTQWWGWTEDEEAPFVEGRRTEDESGTDGATDGRGAKDDVQRPA